MTVKITITDEHAKAMCRAMGGGWEDFHEPDVAAMKRKLEWAFNPPPEPEIAVTEEMLKAGSLMYCAFAKWPGDWDGLRAAYRAMDRARLAECCHEWRRTFINRVCHKCNAVEPL